MKGIFSYFLVLSALVTTGGATSAFAGTLSGSAPATGAGTVDLTTTGSVDWMHLGLTASSDINRKATGGSLLSFAATVGTASRFAGNSAVLPDHEWTDGAPAASASAFPGGIFIADPNAAYEITAPADTNLRTIAIELGGFNSLSEVVASLSDGSAPPISFSIGNLSGVYHNRVELSYSADGPATLSVTQTTTSGTTGNVALQSVALAGAPVNQPPAVNAGDNRNVVAGNALTFVVSATDPDGPGGIAMTIQSSTPSLPAAATYTDNNDGTADFDWMPTLADVGVYSVTFAATDDDGNGDTGVDTIDITVAATGGSGTLSGSAPATGAGTVDLTTTGSVDWMHLGLTASSDINRKATGGSLLSFAATVGTASRFAGNSAVLPDHEWTDGAPAASASAFPGGIFIADPNAAYEITAPADTNLRTIAIELGGFNSLSEVVASLSDGSAPPISFSIGNLSGVYHNRVELSYSADGPATLSVTQTTTSGTTGNVALQSVALAGAPVNQPPAVNAGDNRNVVAGNALTFVVSATDPDGPGGIAMTIQSSTPSLPAAATYTDNNDGTADFDWMPTLADVGVYSVTFAATDDDGNGDTGVDTIDITVAATGGSGTLSGSAPATGAGTVDLTTTGSVDWMHLGLTASSDINRKATGGSLLSFAATVGTASRFAGNSAVLPDHEWTDGAPAASASAFPGGIFIADPNAAYEITAPADTNLRTIAIELGGFNSLSEVVASLSDGSAPPISFSIGNLSGVYHNRVELSYSADGPATLSVTQTTTSGTTGNVALQSVALAGAPVNQPPAVNAGDNRNVVAGNALTFVVSATDPDGPGGIAMTIQSSTPSLPAAATYTDNNDGTADFDWMPTLADVGVYSVTFAATDDDGNGDTGVDTIDITVAAGNSAPTITSPGNQSVVEDAALNFTVSATDPDGPGGIAMTIQSSTPSLPAAATYTDNNDGTADFDWVPTAADIGVYSVTFAATDDDGNGDTGVDTIDIEVTAAAVGGTLSGTAPSTGAGTIDLSTTGTIDWLHVGLAQTTDINRKATGGSEISLAITGSPGRFGGNAAVLPSHDWNDGSPTASVTGFPGGIFLPNENDAFELTVPSDTMVKTLAIELGGFQSDSELVATLSDGSATPVTFNFGNLSGIYHHRVVLSFSSPGPATLTVTHTLTNNAGGNIALQSAALASVGPGASLPFLEDFSSPVATDWIVVDESTDLSDWVFQSGRYDQQNNVEVSSARAGTFQLGSYSYWQPGLSLQDYEFSTDFVTEGEDLGEDIGVMFRFNDANNYYRLSLNARQSYTRLEKVVAGVFTPLATNSRGYQEGVPNSVRIVVEGSQILVWLNGDPLFALEDSSLLAGTVGFYAKRSAQFDDLSLIETGTASEIVMQSPLAYSYQSGNNIVATAQALNVPPGGSVEFLLDNTTSVVDSSPPYSALFSSLAAGDHTVEAILLDSSDAELDRDTNVSVGTGGQSIIGIGDSVENGIGDSFAGDNMSADGRIIGDQGRQAVLSDLLADNGMPSIIFNEGIGGDTSQDMVLDRISSILQRNAGADVFLVGFGTNDTFQPIPSGLGCSGASCDGTFKGNMQDLVDQIEWSDYPVNTIPSGREAWVSRTAPVFVGSNPFNSSANNRIRDYNDVIDNELIGIDVGPQFFDYFLESASSNRESLFADNLHPNALGHLVMAHLWHNSLNSGATVPLPFVLDDLEVNGLSSGQQTLIEDGDEYYLDAPGVTVVSQPAALAEGRWILTSASDVDNSNGNYIVFDVDRAVDVYVAYDAGVATLPSWLSSYTFTGQTITTTDPDSPTLDLYLLSVSANTTVTMGGNQNGGASGANSNFVAIIVEN